MLRQLFNYKEHSRVLCLGAHPDDIEIGCGATILKIISQSSDMDFEWVVFSGNEQRKIEAKKSASDFLALAKKWKLTQMNFRISYFPGIRDEIKDHFESLKKEYDPDLIFTHYKFDLHQDHKVISQLTWNTFRNNLILEYEIPKYDADLSSPNFFVGIDDKTVEKKIAYILKNFKSQENKKWFDEETFRSILRIRGVESNTHYAEGFYCRKMVV